MKKFIAIVMSLAMVLSMMTVVSFAEGEAVVIGPKEDITAAPGEELTIPVYFTWADASAACEIDMFQFKMTVDEDIDFTLTEGDLYVAEMSADGVLSEEDCEAVKWEATNTINVVFEAYRKGPTFDADTVMFTINAVAPAEAGTYNIGFEALDNGSLAEVVEASKYDLVSTTVNPITITVEKDEPKIADGFYNLTTADNKASVTYFGTVDAATLYVATYNYVGTGLELVSVKAAPIAAGTVAELTTVETEAADAGEVVKAFLWDANMNAVTVGTLAE